ncbi:response regulator transcription factor [Nitrospirillum iridis]|uniref:DNA-binding NtrC family response regulator n=1 Tax=Nitrospirillum iridis TaxID=765888 RepID=A0A7X0B3K1_9PROT|nr:DNA-binding response regulator [Nitrospirillum iridis]MBB6255079.1 DNA-binding NtrC family response regulator [Nitrospirillum iridis]
MTRLPAVLIVDDDADVRHAAQLALGPHVEAADAAASPQDMAVALVPGRFGCVLLDMNFITGARSGREGLDALAQIRTRDPSLAVVLMTAYGGVSLAVESLKRGAHDFLLKPWRNQDLLAAVRSASEATQAARRGRPLDVLERDAIKHALAENEGNIAQAATALGLSRPALYRRMARHGL